MTTAITEDEYPEPDEPPVRDKPIECYLGTVAFTIGLANKQYGGPEEGGWYYDTFSPRRVFYLPRRFSARFRKRLERWCLRMNKSEKRYPPSSVLCHGWWTMIPGSITTDLPEERPYYE